MSANTYFEIKSIDKDFFKEVLISRKIEQRQQATLRAMDNMRKFGNRIAFVGLIICVIASYFVK